MKTEPLQFHLPNRDRHGFQFCLLGRLAFAMIAVVASSSPRFSAGVEPARAKPAGSNILWYDKPAAPGMNEALPIGNGKFGGLVYGGLAQERIVLNEDSLWTGSEVSSDDYEKMGRYQMLGELLIELSGQETEGSRKDPPNYRRDLNISEAIAHMSGQIGEVSIGREYFVSHPAGVMAVSMTTTKRASHSGTVMLSRARTERKRSPKTIRWLSPGLCRTD